MEIRQPGDDDRFRDPRTRLYSLADADIIVVCPRCGSAAVVRTRHDPTAHWFDCPRHLSCLTCAYTAEWQRPASWSWGGPFDPFFKRPLWLQASCCGGKTLWALNREHLDLIDSYVRARLRERSHDRAHMSLLEKLPAWIKSAKNRDEVARTIQRLRATLPSEVA
jgi:hypothetical protein